VARPDRARKSYVELEKVAQSPRKGEDTVATLAEDVITLAEATTTLTSEIRMVDHARKSDRRQTLLVFALLGIGAILMGVGVWRLNTLSDQNHRLVARIESCTSPGGECYQRGQKQTGEAVENINKFVIWAAECSNDGEPDPVVERCIKQKFAADQVKR
jgi:hypothetical protein